MEDTSNIEVGMSISAGTYFPAGTTVGAVGDKFIYASQKSLGVGGQIPIAIILNSFEECFRGFSGIDQIQQDIQSEFLQFSLTDADDHTVGSVTDPKYVFNLSNLFLQEFFTKFKSEFLPGFENRSSSIKNTTESNSSTLNVLMFCCVRSLMTCFVGIL